MNVMDQCDIDSMFTFNVAAGVSCFIMAYEIIVLAVKAWATKEAVQYHENSWSAA